jgi:hypothetical protein
MKTPNRYLIDRALAKNPSGLTIHRLKNFLNGYINLFADEKFEHCIIAYEKALEEYINGAPLKEVIDRAHIPLKKALKKPD